MRLTRRHLLRATARLGGAVGVAASGAAARLPLAEAAVTAARTAPATLGRTIRRGPVGQAGYGPLVSAPGERHVLRTDLGIRPTRGRARRRKPIIAFAQLSDVHIVDVQSPLRVEWTDRMDDPSSSGAPTATGTFASAYRPHEMLTGHIADAMIRRINDIGRGPITGKPLALAIQTGDNSDNSQRNEVRWNIDLLDGKTVRIDSGDLTRWEGVADDDPSSYDVHYWHPDGTPDGATDDIPRAQRGFPTVPGLLDAARRPFKAQGLKMPWYAAFGNHDGLSQGNFPRTLQLNNVAVGSTKIISPPTGVSPADLADAVSGGDLGGLISSVQPGPGVRTVAPDPDRRLISRDQIVEEHFTTSGLPKGHGFTQANRRDGTAYYFFDRGPCRFIVMDTVNPNGMANGSIDTTQLEWLHTVLRASAKRLVMVFSHHTSDTMNNPLTATGADSERRVMGGEVLDVLLAHRQVVAWINGHTHQNQVFARRHPDGRSGLWEINTAAHIDWPQQARLIEIVDNRDHTLSIFTTIVDHAGPVSYGGRLDDSVHLAGLARELSANDWHTPGDKQLGTRKDRNVELVVTTPYFLRRRRR